MQSAVSNSQACAIPPGNLDSRNRSTASFASAQCGTAPASARVVLLIRRAARLQSIWLLPWPFHEHDAIKPLAHEGVRHIVAEIDEHVLPHGNGAGESHVMFVEAIVNHGCGENSP